MNAALKIASVMLVLAAAPALAQAPVGPMPSQAARNRVVMSGADFDAAMDAAGFDEAQRTIAAASFDDIQPRMFAAKRAADAEAAEDRVRAARALRQQVLAEVDALFAALGAVARPEQRTALERERRTARVRTVRATVDVRRAGRAATTDVDAMLVASGLDAQALARARAAISTAMEPLEAALVRVAESREALERAVGPRGKGVAIPDAARKEVADAAKALCDLHRRAIVAAIGAMPPQTAREFAMAAARHLWPATSDAGAPMRTLLQLLAQDAPPERQAAVEAVAKAWWDAWWPATLRIAEATDIDARAGRDPEVLGPRVAADRAAWNSLAGIDQANRDFHLQMASGAPAPGGQRGALAGSRGGPSLPRPRPAPAAMDVAETKKRIAEALGGRVSPDDIEVGGAGQPPAGAAPGGGAGGSPFGIDQYLQDAAHIDDPINDVFAFDSDEPEMALGAARIPPAMSDEEARAIARQLAAPAEGATFEGIVSDYRARAQIAEEQAIAGLRDLLRGSLVRVSLEDDPPEVPDAALRQSIVAIDAHVDRLASIDAALIDALASVGNPPEGARDAAVARRARTRSAGVRYPGGALLVGTSARFVEPWDALPADVPEDARARARKAIEAWSPGASSAIEALRTTARNACPAILLSIRADVLAVRRDPDALEREQEDGDDDAPEPEGMRVGLARSLDRARMAIEAVSMSGRDVTEAALPAELRGAFRAAWNARAAPESQIDPRNALPVIEQALAMGDLDAAQRRQIEALRADHAATHAAMCNAIAEFEVMMSARSDLDDPSDPGPTPVNWIFGDGRLLADKRFERNELDSRSMRRLRSMLRTEQILRIPALTDRPSPAGQKRGRAEPRPGTAGNLP